MKYNNGTRAINSAEKKGKIIDCALKLINEKGFDNVSVSEITALAGVSKGAFYIHFNSKEDLIEKQISLYFDDSKLDGDVSTYEKLKYFLIKSIEQIKKSGLKMCQSWFSHSVRGSFYGKSKLVYDKRSVEDMVKDSTLSDEIVSVYYGALNLWCFTDGEINPEKIVMEYLDNIKERLK